MRLARPCRTPSPQIPPSPRARGQIVGAGGAARSPARARRPRVPTVARMRTRSRVCSGSDETTRNRPKITIKSAAKAAASPKDCKPRSARVAPILPSALAGGAMDTALKLGSLTLYVAMATARLTPRAATMPPRRRAVVEWFQAMLAI